MHLLWKILTLKEVETTVDRCTPNHSNSKASKRLDVELLVGLVSPR